MLKRGASALALGCALMVAVSLAAQGPPYPGAEALSSDQAFVAFQVAAAARAAGVPEEVVLRFTRRSYVTSAPAFAVLDHLTPSSLEAHREPILDREAAEVGFVQSLDEASLSELARALGVDTGGRAYGRAFVAGIEAGSPARRAGGFVAKEEADGALVLYEIQRPYFDARSLRWVDATRIRVVRLPSRDQ